MFFPGIIMCKKSVSSFTINHVNVVHQNCRLSKHDQNRLQRTQWNGAIRTNTITCGTMACLASSDTIGNYWKPSEPVFNFVLTIMSTSTQNNALPVAGQLCQSYNFDLTKLFDLENLKTCSIEANHIWLSAKEGMVVEGSNSQTWSGNYWPWFRFFVSFEYQSRLSVDSEKTVTQLQWIPKTISKNKLLL